jgi:hypothetical protein
MGKGGASKVESYSRAQEARAAKQQAEIAGKQYAWWERLYAPQEQKMMKTLAKPVEEQAYFKRLTGGLEKEYGDIGANVKRALGGRYQYGSGYEGASARNLALSKAATRATAWGQGEEMRRGGLMNMFAIGRGSVGAAQQGLSSAGAMAGDVATQLGNLRAQKMSQITGAASSGIEVAQKAGICCWNFLAAHGSLAEEVKLYRDEHYPKGCPVSKGYKWMSEFAVPLMEQYHKFAVFMDWVMARPMTKYAQWYYKKNWYGWIFKPIVTFWTGLWGEWGKKIPQAKKYYSKESISLEMGC